ncbi:MAG: 3-isopropylmalate dehydratase small subunit [Erythrobacter sp.]|jgi:3-isopropylmalate dehydratase small subunit|nr:3-isopropylmalate dehydratase small subunit [Erythrobacter sp.]
MEPVRQVNGRAIPFGAKNIDTDIIISARWLKTITREGLGEGAFESIRAQPGNLFDNPDFKGAPILIAGDNFGCGSSREHAAWALYDMGIRAVIAPSFSDIFSGNAVKNGIVPVVLPTAAVARLMEVARGGEPIDIDLESETVSTRFQDRFAFTLDPFRRHCLMEGLDEIALALTREVAIQDFESNRTRQRGWMMHGTRAKGR